MKNFHQYTWIVSLGITLMGWVWVMAAQKAITQQKLTDMQKRVLILSDRHQSLLDRLNAIQGSLVQVQTDVRWLRQAWRTQNMKNNYNH